MIVILGLRNPIYTIKKIEENYENHVVAWIAIAVDFLDCPAK
jgi:hypothetical protein